MISEAALILLTLVLVLMPFWPCLKEAWWGQDTEATPISDRQLVDLRDHPERVWTMAENRPPRHYREMSLGGFRREHTETLFFRGSLELQQTDRVFELHVREDLRVRGPLTVAWWLTARNISIESPMVAVGKVQAQEDLLIFAPTRFHHLQGRLIQSGAETFKGAALPRTEDHSRTTHHGDWTLPAGEVFQGDRIVHGTVIIEDGAVLMGSLKVWGDLHLGSRASIRGHTFVTRNAYCEEGSSVSGIFVTERKLVCKGGNTFGHADNPVTVVASEMLLSGSFCVYGILKAWNLGEISPIGSDKRPLSHS